MPSKGKEGYNKLAQRGEDAPNRDWRSDETLELESKWGGIVDFADGKIDGYKLESVLRYGFFRVKAPVFADPFVKMQTLAVLEWLLPAVGNFSFSRILYLPVA